MTECSVTFLLLYTCSADGNRVKRTVGSTNFYYPFPTYEISGTVAIKYYFFGGQRVAMKSGSTLTYLHGDHLGSTALATTSGGAWQSQEKYFAYGKDRDTANSVPTDHKFTGQKSDGSGLIYMNARFFDPLIGTFISPDTVVPDIGLASDYNRYLYSRGNPLRYVDKSGHTPWDVVDVIFLLMSVNDYRQNPTWANMGWLALDGVSTLPIIPSVASYIRRGKQGTELAAKITKMVTKHGDLAVDFVKVAHKKGATTLLEKLIHSSDTVVKGAIFELEFAHRHSDEIVEIGRLLDPVSHAEIDFVLSGNVFVNVKNYDWTSYNPFVLKQETKRLVEQAKSYFKFDPTAVKYVFKGSVPDSVREALEAAGIVVEVVQ